MVRVSFFLTWSLGVPLDCENRDPAEEEGIPSSSSRGTRDGEGRGVRQNIVL